MLRRQYFATCNSYLLWFLKTFRAKANVSA